MLTLYPSDGNKGDLTKQFLEPLLQEVIDILEWAIKLVKAILSLDVGSILKTVTGLLDLDDVVKLIADLLTVSALCFIFSSLG